MFSPQTKHKQNVSKELQKIAKEKYKRKTKSVNNTKNIVRKRREKKQC